MFSQTDRGTYSVSSPASLKYIGDGEITAFVSSLQLRLLLCSLQSWVTKTALPAADKAKLLQPSLFTLNQLAKKILSYPGQDYPSEVECRAAVYDCRCLKMFVTSLKSFFNSN